MLGLLSPEERVPNGHPLRRVKQLADEALAELSGVFDRMDSGRGRPSIPPERLLKASLLMALYSVRSERLLCDPLSYNLLFRWFLDMDMVEDSFDHSVFAKNRERLMGHEVSRRFFESVVGQAHRAGLMSAEHFTVDGTLIEAWASHKSVVPKEQSAERRRRERNRRKAARKRRPPSGPAPSGGGGRSDQDANFHGSKRRNDTHEATTDPEAKLYRKGVGKEAKLSYSAHALRENRNGMLVDLRVAEANGTAERSVALQMLADHGRKGTTVGADRGYDTQDFIEGCRQLGVTPHVAQHTSRRRSRSDGRTTRHPGYRVSQQLRKRVEEIFGWAKSIGGLRRTRFKGKLRTQAAAYLVAAAYNLLRMSRLLSCPP